MDKETAVALAELKAAKDSQEKRLEKIEEVSASWNLLIRNALVKMVSWLIMTGATGLVFGWILPPPIRKYLIEWVSK